ncbi:MAG: hypothetical protein QM680_13965 [Luteolibacter sp.]
MSTHNDKLIEMAASLYEPRDMDLVNDRSLAEMPGSPCMANSMKRELECLSKYPPPTPGTILNRGTSVDKVCHCGRVVTFPLHSQNH